MTSAVVSIPIAAHQEWFGNPQNDSQYLDLWRSAQPTYTRGQPIDNTWHHDIHEMEIGADPDGKLFEVAADLILSYEFYPHSILIHTSDFTVARRHMKVGDNVVQRIRVLRLNGLTIADVLTMTRISEVTHNQDRVGFAYVTTEAHLELGEWSVRVERREENAVWVVIDSISKPGPRIPERSHAMARRFQLEAHHTGLENFKNLCLTGTAALR